MQGEQPGEQAEAQRCRDEEPRGTALLELQVRQIAADDFGERCQDEESEGLEKVHLQSLAGGRHRQTMARRRMNSFKNAALAHRTPVAGNQHGFQFMP